MVEAAVGLLAAQFREHDVVLEIALAQDLPAVEANPFSLEEVVLNLMNNAYDAVEGGDCGRTRTTPEVRISTRRDDFAGMAGVAIDVADNGTGISPEVLPRVFDPFFTTKDPDKGTRLGLSVSKGIMEELKGGLQIRSEPGLGSTATISLPAMANPAA